MINVSNIERFAIKDGPGIRTAVFLKGCPLHCPWCANPETWSTEPLIMHKESVCVSCRECERVCPVRAVSFERGSYAVDRTKCIVCGACVQNCPAQALSVNGTAMSEEEILKEVLKDIDYYEESGGGVTFSGGEPLFQKDAVSLLKAAKQCGLHTAIETTGMVSKQRFREAEPYVDLFLFDIKHIDAAKLKEVTGAGFETIKENFELICSQRGRDVIARIPVIPGFNLEDLDAILAFVRSYPVRGVNLLPFHNFGRTKWHQLQRSYRYDEEKSLSSAELEMYRDDLVSIGG